MNPSKVASKTTLEPVEDSLMNGYTSKITKEGCQGRATAHSRKGAKVEKIGVHIMEVKIVNTANL